MPSGIRDLRDVGGSLFRQAVPLGRVERVPVSHGSTVEFWRRATVGPLVVRVMLTAEGRVRLFGEFRRAWRGDVQVKGERELEIRKGHRIAT